MIQSLLEQIEIVPLMDRIARIAIDLRQKYRLKTPDSIVVATAIYENVPLITGDKSLFKVEEVIVIES